MSGRNRREEDPEPPTLVLHVAYPDAYPHAAPELDISLDVDSEASEYLTFPDDRAQLLLALADTVEENLGMAMVFTLASTLKDAAETLMHERASAEERALEAVKREEEEKEMEKFRGELVNRERFLDWRNRFFAEKAAAKQRVVDDEEAEGKRGQRANTKVEEKKLTGKDLWERGLVGNADDEEEGDDEAIDVSKLKLGN